MKDFIRDTLFTNELNWYNVISYITTYSVYTELGFVWALTTLAGMSIIGLIVESNL